MTTSTAASSTEQKLSQIQIKSVPLDRPDLQEKPVPGGTSTMITREGKRLFGGGRRLDQFRNIFVKTGVVANARGSAYIEMNNTSVLCCVYGPRQMTTEFSERGRLQCEFQRTSFSQLHHSHSNARQAAQQDREFSMYLRDALESNICLDRFPKSVIDLHALVIEDDGGALSAAITCGCLALADASIEMFDLITACSAVELENQIIVDPTAVEERFSNGSVVCAYSCNSRNEITQLTQRGDMRYSKVTEAIELCLDGCRKIAELVKKALYEDHVDALQRAQPTKTTDEIESVQQKS